MKHGKVDKDYRTITNDYLLYDMVDSFGKWLNHDRKFYKHMDMAIGFLNHCILYWNTYRIYVFARMVDMKCKWVDGNYDYIYRGDV